MRKKILAIRGDSAMAGKPFTAFIRAPTITRDDAQRYADAGITNIVIAGRQVINVSMSTDQTLAAFDRMAKELGINPR